jgi:hypothetical protein
MKQPSPSDRPTQDAGRKGLDFNRSMNGWRTLEAAIPHAESDRVAGFLGVVGATVRTWRREPETDDDTSTGRRSPLDRFCDLITAIYLTKPENAELLIEHARQHLESLKEAQRPRPLEPEEMEERLRDLQMQLTQLADAARASSKKEKLSVVR